MCKVRGLHRDILCYVASAGRHFRSQTVKAIRTQRAIAEHVRYVGFGMKFNVSRDLLEACIQRLHSAELIGSGNGGFYLTNGGFMLLEGQL